MLKEGLRKGGPRSGSKMKPVGLTSKAAHADHRIEDSGTANLHAKIVCAKPSWGLPSDLGISPLTAKIGLERNAASPGSQHGYIYIYIYIEREREILCIYIYMYVYIYIYNTK